LGRISLTLTLEELPLYESSLFWGQQRKTVSSYEKFKLLAVTGGVPRYLEEIRPHLSAEENIRDLALIKRESYLMNLKKYFLICFPHVTKFIDIS